MKNWKKIKNSPNRWRIRKFDIQRFHLSLILISDWSYDIGVNPKRIIFDHKTYKKECTRENFENEFWSTFWRQKCCKLQEIIFNNWISHIKKVIVVCSD